MATEKKVKECNCISKEKVSIHYIVGEHPEVKDRIVIAFDGTGINIHDAEHKHFLDVIAKIIASQMYAKANNIPAENVEY